jgi:hypothetical protein
MHILLSLLLLTQNINKRTWRNFSEYSSSLFYVSFFNSLYYFLSKDFLLWDFNVKKSQLKIIRALHIFVITPSLVLLYLSNVPNSMLKHIAYLVKWVMSSTCVEWIAYKKLKMIDFYNGWHLGWSLLVYVKMYFFSWLVIRRPLLTWCISLAVTAFYLYIFNVPVKRNVKQQLEKWKVFLKLLTPLFQSKEVIAITWLAILLSTVALIRNETCCRKKVLMTKYIFRMAKTN